MQGQVRIKIHSAGEVERIEQEHSRLERFLNDLGETCREFSSKQDCSGCERGTQACCQGRLTSFFYDFLDLVAEHIENEEAIVGRYLANADDSRYFKQHQEAHGLIMGELRRLMEEAVGISKHGQTAEAIRRLHQKISHIFGSHARDFDDHFRDAA